MNRKLLSAVCVAALTIGGAAQAQDSAMTFFLATNPGKGGDLGGLTGADARCQSLAKEANAGGKTWRGALRARGEGGQAGGGGGGPGRADGSRRTLPVAREGGERGWKDVAGVSQRQRRGRAGGGECARPDRERTVAQREGRGDRKGRGRAARESEHQLRHGADGEGRVGQQPAHEAQLPRHPYRLAAQRARVSSG